MNWFQLRWPLLLFGNVAVICVLCFYEATSASPQQPFNNATQQREETIRELREIKTLLREQNTLLRSANEPPATARPR
ncbi:hypothetical protein [Lignipirellula cremea]|uniref:Uncharacterized protein n=1 Tax=Lignipirellula cremea TaxID=2528010 RepID=A0A518DSD8_9BACT|nr:hypothetical protein [Lignipirellula cremea]QDU94760.1 hypothetical protein Pla8534_25670 [Lignipirellula cremea]